MKKAKVVGRQLKRERIPVELLSGGYQVTSPFTLVGGMNRAKEYLTDDRQPATISSLATDEDWQLIGDAISRHVCFELGDIMDVSHPSVLNDRQFRALYDRVCDLPRLIVEAVESLGAAYDLETELSAMHATAAIVPLSIAHGLRELIVEQRVVLFVPCETDLSS